jgi:hypothetical protein
MVNIIFSHYDKVYEFCTQMLNSASLVRLGIRQLVMWSQTIPSYFNLLGTFPSTGYLKPPVQSVDFIYTHLFPCLLKGDWSGELHHDVASLYLPSEIACTNCIYLWRIVHLFYTSPVNVVANPLNAELNPICHLLALLGAHNSTADPDIPSLTVWGGKWNSFCNFMRKSRAGMQQSVND